ncbi:MAG: transglutaminase-like domain-containing protein [Paenibacillaceae bacterium]
MNTATPYEYKPARHKFMSVLDSIFSHWQYKLRVFLTGLVLAQFIVWFDSYWLQETTWLVSAVLVITFLIEMFPRFHWMIRRSVQVLLILITHIEALNMSWTPVESGMLGGRLRWFGDFLSSLGHYLTQFSPFIWYSLGAWVIYLVSIAWFTERARIILVIVCSVILFAIIDSYSHYIFWEQVAYIIFSGLALIVIEHFEHFRLKHPVSWSYFSDYPFVIATPIILIIAVIMLIGSLAPNARPLLTDPYTAYMHLKGQKVITSGKGFASTSTQSLLNTSSGYGRDDSAIGGGFDFDFSEVLRVETDQRSYLRGETKSLYTGKGWELSNQDKNANTVNAAFQTELEPFEWGTAPTYKSIEVEQIIRLTNDKSYPVLFGAYPISSIENVQMMQGQVKGLPSDAFWSSAQAELQWNSDVPYPLMYTLHSKLPIIDEVALREGPALTTEYEDEQWKPYLQLPEALPDRVGELAKNITRSATSPYDKVKLIETYLQENFEYTNRPDLSLGKSEDFVDRFLFEIKTGYCDYFSTSMAVMVRTLGLPTRWVKGYTGGNLDVDDLLNVGIPEQIANQVGIQTYIVKNSDAHSWVEVYLDGWGWIPFEPTSGFVLPTITEAKETLASTLDPLANPTDLTENGTANDSWYTPIKIILTAIVLLVGVSIIVLGIRLGWWRSLRISRRERRGLDMNQQALQEMSGIIRMFNKKGYIRHLHETMRESFARWNEQNRWLKKDLDQLLGLMEKAKYSPYSVTGDDLVLMIKMKRKLKEEL